MWEKGELNEGKREPACAICGAPRYPRYRPFCSPRCADVDLQRWLNDTYTIPVPEGEEEPREDLPVDVAGHRERGQL
jgi:hypothetical protein